MLHRSAYAALYARKEKKSAPPPTVTLFAHTNLLERACVFDMFVRHMRPYHFDSANAARSTERSYHVNRHPLLLLLISISTLVAFSCQKVEKMIVTEVMRVSLPGDVGVYTTNTKIESPSALQKVGETLRLGEFFYFTPKQAYFIDAKRNRMLIRSRDKKQETIRTNYPFFTQSIIKAIDKKGNCFFSTYIYSNQVAVVTNRVVDEAKTFAEVEKLAGDVLLDEQDRKRKSKDKDEEETYVFKQVVTTNSLKTGSARLEKISPTGENLLTISGVKGSFEDILKVLLRENGDIFIVTKETPETQATSTPSRHVVVYRFNKGGDLLNTWTFRDVQKSEKAKEYYSEIIDVSYINAETKRRTRVGANAEAKTNTLPVTGTNTAKDEEFDPDSTLILLVKKTHKGNVDYTVYEFSLDDEILSEKYRSPAREIPIGLTAKGELVTSFCLRPGKYVISRHNVITEVKMRKSLSIGYHDYFTFRVLGDNVYFLETTNNTVRFYEFR